MFNSKMINPGVFKDDKEEKPKSKLVLLIEKICGKLSNIKIKFEPFGYQSLIYDIAVDGLSLGFAQWWGRIWDKVSLRQFRENTEISCSYFKQGWGSRDFDSAYALDDFMWKIKNLADHIEKHKLHVNWHRDVKRIRKVLELMERVREDDYNKEAMAELDKKYGPSINYTAKKTDMFNDFKDLPMLRDGGCITMSKRWKENDNNTNQIHKETRAAYRKAARTRQREWKAALKIMQEHFFEWWD